MTLGQYILLLFSSDIYKTIKIRALEEIMCIEPEVQALISNEKDVFYAMLQQLKR